MFGLIFYAANGIAKCSVTGADAANATEVEGPGIGTINRTRPIAPERPNTGERTITVEADARHGQF